MKLSLGEIKSIQHDKKLGFTIEVDL